MATIFETVSELGKIVTDAITAGNDTNIPERIVRNTLIKVSTGSYKEVLPIVVPAECCILGDELRSTNVQPRKATNSTLTPIEDFNYSFEGFKRFEAVIEDIVSGVSVTPTIGNNETQITTWPLVENTNQKQAVSKLVRNIRKRIDVGLGTKKEANLSKPYTLPNNNGWAIELIKLNKEFLKAEVVAYLQDNYPTLAYSKTKCKQDIGFLIDSISYDLIYGGNWQSVKAGEAYYEGTNFNISTSEKTATIAVYGVLRDLMVTLSTNIAVTPTYQSVISAANPVIQIKDQGYSGDANSSNRIISLMNNIISIVTNGSGTVAINYPDTANVASNLSDANIIMTNLLPELQVNTIDFINGHFGSFQYNSAKCRRDLNYIITDTAYDVALGTNYNAVFQGTAYQRPVNAYNTSTQRIETIGAVRRARDLLKITVTTDGSSEIGSSTSSNRIDTAYNEIVSMLNGNVATALSYPDSFTGITQAQQYAKNLLIANKNFLIEDTIAYIGNTFPTIYNETKCRRDVGYIVESLIYDILYGGTQASTRIAESYFVNGVLVELESSNLTSQQLAGYLGSVYQHLYSKAGFVVIESATAEPNNPVSPTTLGTPAGALEQSRITGELRPIVVDAVAGQSLSGLPAIVFPDLSALGVTSEFISTVSNIESDKNDVIKSTVQYITNTYNDFNYDHEKCSRDIALIVNAASYDMMLDTNFASIQAAYSYLRAPSKKVVGDQKTATLAANEYVRLQIVAALGSNTTAIEKINQSWEWIQDIIFSGSNEANNRQTEDVEMYNAVRHLELNKEFIVNEVLSYVDNKFKDTVTSYLINGEVTISDTSWLFPGMPVKFRVGDDSTQSVINAGLSENITYYVSQITGNTTFTLSESKFGAGKTNLVDTLSTNFEVYKAYDYNRELCARDVREYIDAIKWDLIWPQENHRHYNKYGFDVSLYLPGIYKTRLAARYYVNSVVGSQEEDMYYLRNGTGLRLQTVDGLQGDLGPANSLGTQRPTAGAYASLDPGWGPDDQRVWITARSPYVQNVTTFGYAAVGQKIDGSLHNGGNDSIVSNDFTQIISDGIGAWLLNNGRAELVSVFTYYAHIGYLSESGGRIRATNGNNSYGKFGSVAEGVDADEIPITAIVDNRTQYKATVSEVYTDTAEILQVEYNHAGNDYTEAEFRFFGVGYGESQLMQEFRDEAVNQVRVVEIADSTGNPDATAGGENYLFVSNTAQAGALTNITIAATDGNSSTAYPGMAIYLTGGVGAGQYGVIDTYNAGSKVATVKRMTDGEPGWDHGVSGTTIVAPNSTSIYQIEPQMYYSSPSQSDSSHTLPATESWTDPNFVETSNQYTNLVPETQSDGSGATFDVTRVGEKYYVSLTVVQSPNVFEDGENYTRLDTLTIKGSQLGGLDDTHDIVITITVVDSATGAIIDFDFSGYGNRGYFVLANDNLVNNVAWSRNGETWADGTVVLGVAQQPVAIGSGLLDDGSSTYKPSRIIMIVHDGINNRIECRYASDKILGSDNFDWQSGGTLNATAGITGNIDIAYADLGNALNRFVVCENSIMYYTDDGGVNWSSTAVANNYTSIAYGQGVFLAIVRNGGSQTSLTFATSTDGINWIESTEAVNGDWVDIAYGKNKFVVIDTDGNGLYTLDAGATWNVCPGGISRLSNGAQSTAATRRITYGQGVFAVTTNSGAVPFSEDGVYWTNRVSISGSSAVYSVGDYTITNGPDAGTFTTGLRGIVFGNNDHNPIFVARANGLTTNDVAVIKLGCTTKSRVSVANAQVYEFRITEPGAGYTIAPDTLLVDNNNTADVLYNVRLNNGVLAQPTFINRGTGFISASAEIVDDGSNGNADFLQDGNYIAVSRLSATPVNGSNVVFDSLPDKTFKLVNTVSLVGLNDGSKKGFLQISPKMEIEDSVIDKDPVTLRIRFSQVRLTGHDFLDIGTGNFEDTNYPNEINGDPVNEPDQTNETVASNGGRVFFTATDQDGNFRVGDLFSIEQATGVATLSADAFNIAGLQELTLGEVTLGGNSASITEFSTDEFFTANSDSVIPTQRAIKAYIEAQIGGGGASIIVNSVTAGDIYINTNQITTLSGQQINIKANVNFTKPVLGYPLAFSYFLR